jgi:hypothetical protein
MLLWAALVVRGPGRRRRPVPRHRAVPVPPRHIATTPRRPGQTVTGARSHSGAGIGPSRFAVVASREEDRVRPAVDRSGARIWVDEQDLFWYDIVAWPPRRKAAKPPVPTRRSAEADG